MELDQIANWIMTHPGLLQGNSVIADNAPFSSVPLSMHHAYQGNPRLGFIYQHVCSELFNASPEYQLLAEEIQLIRDKKTLGAIDFIAHNIRTQHIEHWEVAIKFYLLHDELWYGPNPKDRLDKKLDRMLHHQLAINQTSVFRERFPQWENVDPKLLMQGRLYTNPFRNERIPTHCFEFPVNQSQITGHWCYRNEVSQIPEPIYPLEKWQWMAGHNGAITKNVQSHTQFTHYQSASGTFWFIVPEHWPDNR
ncbi:DUF1853 family protein [Vibrio salinus]|uniref:DUF1853 family protein n=1 Tax=Vibrio salinus TaxID=2899784 RepID=UPI001E33DE12|nr:DUF1853 family protein [Vibrio salinus]MCE0494551.1 DUF1853 family protein [Vibrio salinus]